MKTGSQLILYGYDPRAVCYCLGFHHGKGNNSLTVHILLTELYDGDHVLTIAVSDILKIENEQLENDELLLKLEDLFEDILKAKRGQTTNNTRKKKDKNTAKKKKTTIYQTNSNFRSDRTISQNIFDEKERRTEIEKKKRDRTKSCKTKNKNSRTKKSNRDFIG